jgi:hypothetical protein
VVSDPLGGRVAKELHPKNSVGPRELVNEVKLSNLPVRTNGARCARCTTYPVALGAGLQRNGLSGLALPLVNRLSLGPPVGPRGPWGPAGGGAGLGQTSPVQPPLPVLSSFGCSQLRGLPDA